MRTNARSAVALLLAIAGAVVSPLRSDAASRDAFCMTALPCAANGASVSRLEIPILGWYGIPAGIASFERYAEARDMGITILMQWAPDVKTARRLLDDAQKAGIKLQIHMGALADAEKCEGVVNALKDHPALAMYHVVDEPTIKKFPGLAEVAKKINALDPAHEPYVNLVHSVDDALQWYGGEMTYAQFVNKFLDEVPVKSVSFDCYPVYARKRFPGNDYRICDEGYLMRTNWFETLEVCAAAAKARKLPLYAFALSCAHRVAVDYPEPQVRFMLLEQNANLAYGAQLLQYFVYWPVLSNPMNYQYQPFSNSKPHRRTSVFDRVREVNRRIQARAFVFKGCSVERVRHTGADIPTSTVRLAKGDLPKWVRSLETPDGGAVVSRLTNGGTEYVAIVNRSPDKELTLKIAFAPGVKYIRSDGTFVDASLYSGEYWMEPGAMEIFCFRK